VPEQFHFLQPQWLLALIPLALLVWLLRHAATGNNPWARIIDARLQPLLLMGQTQKTHYFLLWLLALAWLIAIFALADPAWEKQPRPLFQTSAARVIVLDLSRSMLNRDITPSRLARARFKVEDILARDEEGQTGLVVFAGDAFTVTPLTRDAETIRALLKALDPELMPVQGSRADLGLQKAGELLQQAGLNNGQILLLADGVDGRSNDKARDAADDLRSKGYRVSVLGVGTESPEPLTNAQGQLLRTQDGQLIRPPLETAALRAVAEAGGGRYHGFSGSDNDITALLTDDTPATTENPVADDLQGHDWESRGPWLVVLLLPLAALAFRRGWLLSVALVVGVMLPPQPAMAFGWDDLWQRPDQQASKALAEKDYERASQVAKDPLLRGGAEYRRGNYEQALDAFSQASGAIADYDRGNALAKLGRYEEAVTAYENALRSSPDMEDAQANKRAVEDLLRQQQQNNDPSQSQQAENNNEEGGEESNEENSTGNDSESDSSNDSNNNEESQQSESSSQSQQTGSDEQSDTDGQSQPNDASQNAEQNDFADAVKALEDEQTDDASKEQEQTAGTAGQEPSEKPPEKHAENNDPPSSVQQQAPLDAPSAHAQTLSSEEQMAAEQWLRRIPDDPGGLLRRKFQYQYQRQAPRKGTGSAQPW